MGDSINERVEINNELCDTKIVETEPCVIKYGRVTACGSLSDYKYLISCGDYNYTLIACADCCSESWFEFDFVDEDLIDKVVADIKNMGDVELPESNRQECDKNLLYHIYLQGEEEPLVFYLRNSSNGYYDGWLDIEKETIGTLY